MNIEIFTVGSGYGYSVGAVFQEFDPDQPGNTPMTLERAEQAAEVASRLGMIENLI